LNKLLLIFVLIICFFPQEKNKKGDIEKDTISRNIIEIRKRQNQLWEINYKLDSVLIKLKNIKLDTLKL